MRRLLRGLPVKIDIPSVLIHLRGRVVREEKARLDPERLTMKAIGRTFGSQKRYEVAQRLARLGRGPLGHLPGPLSGWTAMRELPEVPDQTFREGARERRAG